MSYSVFTLTWVRSPLARTFLVITLGAFQLPLDSSASELEIAVLDEHGSELPSRVLVRASDGQCIVPAGAVELVIGPDRWFMSPGTCKLDVPEGAAIVRAEHGHEFSRHKASVSVSEDFTKKQITLRRWINMRERGYACGENHLHVDTQQLAPMLVCEGLDFGSSLTWFNGPDPRRPVPPGSGKARLLQFAGRGVPTSVFDAELEYAWGAAYIQNLPRPIDLASDRQRPNLDYIKESAQAGGIVHYQGGWSREVAVDALLGLVHTVNVCNNNFHMHRYQQRSHYSNLLEVDGFPVYPDSELGMMRMNTDTYYRLLNWGLKLAAGAGSATGVKQVPVGYNRAYVRLSAESTLDEFYRQWAAGRNFVTNGPMLLLSTDDGQRPGDTIRFESEGGSITATVEAMCQPNVSLQSLELIVNGQVAASIPISDPRNLKGRARLNIEEGSWIAARCTARDDLLRDEELAVYSWGSNKDRFRMRPSRLRFAHTSPIYVRVDGQLAAVSRSIREGLRMLDSFQRFARSNAAAKYQPSILAGVEQARRQLQSRLEAGNSGKNSCCP